MVRFNPKTFFQALLTVVLVVGFTACQQTGKSGIAGRNGQDLKANTAQNIPSVGTQSPKRRDQNFQYTFTSLEFDQCRDSCMRGACQPRCQEILYVANANYFGGPGFESFVPQINFFGNQQMTGNNFMFPAQQWAGNNQGFVNGFQNHWDQTYQANSFYTPHNMKAFCNDPYQFTSESVNFAQNPCGQMDINYLVPGGNANRGLNYMINGQPTQAQNIWQQGQSSCKGNCFGVNYRTYWGTRNVAQENEVVKADLKNTWENLKKLPGNAAMRLSNGILNNIMTQAMMPVAQIEAQLAAQNYTASQKLNYYTQITNMYMDALSIPVYAHGATCDGNAGGNTSVHNGQVEGQFVVLSDEPETGEYIITCAD